MPDIIINICGVINDNMPASILAQGMSIIVQLTSAALYTSCPVCWPTGKILEAVLSVISAINWLNIGKTILTGGQWREEHGLQPAERLQGRPGALAWIKSLPSQAVQWGKNLIQSFINGLTGKGGAVGAGAIAATAGATIAKPPAGTTGPPSGRTPTPTWPTAPSPWRRVVPAYTKSGDAATKASKKTKAAAQATEALL